MQSVKYILSLIIAMSMAVPLESQATVTWTFTWYCSGCSKIGARTEGTEGPFATKSECESARSWMSGQYRSGDVDVVEAKPCSPQGEPDTPGPSSGPPDRGNGGDHEYPHRVDDYERESAQRHEERLEAEYQRREAERVRQEAERRGVEESKQREFIRERDAAVIRLKGSSSAPFGIKGSPAEGLQLKGMARHSETPVLSTAWAKLQCAGSLSIDAIRVAGLDNPDIEKVRFIGREAMKALNGERLETGCLTEPGAVPSGVDGKEYPDVSLQRKFFTDLVAEVLKQTSRIVEIQRDASVLAAQRAVAKDDMQELGNQKDVDPQVLHRAKETVRGIDWKLRKLQQQERKAKSALVEQEKRVKHALSNPTAVFPATRTAR